MTGTLATNDVALRRTVLSNGLTVLSEHMPGVRSVALGAWVRAASVHESPRTMGLSHLLEHMVFKGTERRSAKDIALALESVGGSLDAYTSREHTSYQARVLDEDVEIAADVLADLIFRPLLRTTDLELERKVVLEEISTVEDTPDDMVFELHGARLWGDHPYGYPILGTRETVSSFTSEDLQTLHRRAYHPEHIVVAASGNIEHEDLIQILEDAGWTSFPSGGQSRLVSTPAVPALPTITHFNREGAQTHVVLGTATVPHGDPRRYAMALVSTLLGGGMSSRLFQRVREELGLAYSVYSFQSFHHDAGISGVYVGTAPDTATLATEAIIEELSRVASEGLPDDEIAAGKNQLKGQITLSLESVSSRMYRAAGVELYDEEFRSLDEVLALIDSIDRDTVLAVCRDFFASDVQTIVSLGPGGSTRIPSINNEN